MDKNIVYNKFISNNVISNNIITYLYIKIICEDDGD